MILSKQRNKEFKMQEQDFPQSETEIQKAIADYFAKAGYLVIRINSGRKKNIPFCKIWNSGKTSGVSDLIIANGNDVWFVEVKDAQGAQSDSQKDFEYVCKSIGCKYFVARSLDHARKIIENS